jgi:hypothetical protein
MRSRVCGGGPWSTVCVVARVGKAGLERPSGGGGISPKNQISTPVGSILALDANYLWCA